MQRKMLLLVLASVLVSVSLLDSGRIQRPALAAVPFDGPDLYIKDTPSDTGLEPNPDSGPMWVSEDIWVRTTPDPGYQPYPFPEGSPPWIPLAHENPEYRDPKYSVPNYVYVRVRNRGNSASTGTERLRVFWAKASTGLSWPTQWGGGEFLKVTDYQANNCGPTKLYGAEVTKPRKNAGTATAAERNAYQSAIVSAGTMPAFVFFGGVSYWHKQQEVHFLGPGNRHGSAAFLPWHREFVNRYEVLLQEVDPTVKLLYWDWTTDPANSTGGFNFFTSTFMGASGRGTGGTSIGLPFIPALSPPTITRNLNISTTPPAQADTTVLGNGLYQAFAPNLEGAPNHNSAHGYIGGGGNMSFISAAAQDPFFFLLHTNVDRLWAQWQRAAGSLSRLDPPTAFDGDSPPHDANITTTMGPWDGTGTSIQPWTVAGGYIVAKAPLHPSVVSPPIYDTAPLVIPVLQPGEAVVIQIPWYPPNPADFACFGSDQGHFCLLARIETSATAPFGMTFPEGTDVYTNTKNNNNIAWKNVTVVDNFPGPFKVGSVLVRNVFRQRVLTGLRFANTQEIGASFSDFGLISVDLKPELLKRWREGGSVGRGIRLSDDAAAARVGTIQLVSPDASIENIALEADEAFSLDVRFELAKDYRLPPRGILPKWDVIQTGAPGNPNAIVGGQRFELDFSKLVLIKAGDQWRYLDDGSNPGPNWVSVDFDDSKWKQGQAELGFGADPVTTIDGGPPNRRHGTTYFRHTFEVTDPSFFRDLLLRLKRDDGAVVYLNGTEVHRVNLPEGPLRPRTHATRDVIGLEEKVFFPVRVSLEHLRPGRNVIAVEIHVASPNSQDLTFDLELSANPAVVHFPPYVAFASPMNGTLWPIGQVMPVEVEALDPDGQVTSVSLYADGKLVGTDDKPPYKFKWQGGSIGAHRLRAVATNNNREHSEIAITVTVAANVPPTVRLTQPSDGAAFEPGEVIFVAARASDQDGKVKRVEFYLRDADLFVAPSRLAGTAKAAPYAVQLKGLEPGHYMLTAVATDNGGATSQSIPIHFEVTGPHSTH
jgi:hypothetical protein